MDSFCHMRVMRHDPPNPKNIETICQVGDIVFDQKKGLGAVPINTIVASSGVVVMMQPRDFLRLAQPLPPEQRNQKSLALLRDAVRDGQGIASPFLYLGIPEEPGAQLVVTGHEGRHRSIVADEVDLMCEIPVHVFFKREVKARDLRPEPLRSLLRDKIVAEGTRMPTRISPERIFLRGEELTIDDTLCAWELDEDTFIGDIDVEDHPLPAAQFLKGAYEAEPEWMSVGDTELVVWQGPNEVVLTRDLRSIPLAHFDGTEFGIAPDAEDPEALATIAVAAFRGYLPWRRPRGPVHPLVACALPAAHRRLVEEARAAGYPVPEQSPRTSRVLR